MADIPLNTGFILIKFVSIKYIYFILVKFIETQ